MKLLHYAALMVLTGLFLAPILNARVVDQGIGKGSIKTWPDRVLVASATPTVVLPANTAREAALCEWVSGTARVGDSSIAAAQGALLSSGNPLVLLPTNVALYAFSSGGGVIACNELMGPAPR